MASISHDQNETLIGDERLRKELVEAQRGFASLCKTVEDLQVQVASLSKRKNDALSAEVKELKAIIEQFERVIISGNRQLHPLSSSRLRQPLQGLKHMLKGCLLYTSPSPRD